MQVMVSDPPASHTLDVCPGAGSGTTADDPHQGLR